MGQLPARLVLKRSSLRARDDDGSTEPLSVDLLGSRADGSAADYVAEIRFGARTVRVDVTALLRALTPDPEARHLS